MNLQLVRKIVVIFLLLCSAILTAGLTYVYLSVLMGWVSGAGAAQWQMAFASWPIPVLLGVPALVLSFFPRPILASKYIVFSLIVVSFPVVLTVLVTSHVY